MASNWYSRMVMRGRAGKRIVSNRILNTMGYAVMAKSWNNVTFIDYLDLVSSKFAITFLCRNDNHFGLKIQAAFART